MTKITVSYSILDLEEMFQELNGTMTFRNFLKFMGISVEDYDKLEIDYDDNSHFKD